MTLAVLVAALAWGLATGEACVSQAPAPRSSGLLQRTTLVRHADPTAVPSDALREKMQHDFPSWEDGAQAGSQEKSTLQVEVRELESALNETKGQLQQTREDFVDLFKAYTTVAYEGLDYATMNARSSLIALPLKIYLACALYSMQGVGPDFDSFLPMPANGSAAAVAERVVAQADHIYVLCMLCDKVSLARSWTSKATLVQGKLADACFGTDAFHDENSRHSGAVTLSHKMIAAHAQSLGHRTIAFIEEDFRVLDAGGPWQEPEVQRLEQYIRDSPWQVLRLNLLPTCVDLACSQPMPGACGERCACHEIPNVLDRGKTRVLCSVAANCPENHASGAYLLSDRVAGTLDKYHQAKGVVDVNMLGELPQTLLLPALFAQPKYSEEEMQKRYASCVKHT